MGKFLSKTNKKFPNGKILDTKTTLCYLFTGEFTTPLGEDDGCREKRISEGASFLER